MAEFSAWVEPITQRLEDDDNPMTFDEAAAMTPEPFKTIIFNASPVDAGKPGESTQMPATLES